MSGLRVYQLLLLLLILIVMKNEQFELKLLLRQNTELAAKLQSYRRENQELRRQNGSLHCGVQNLSDVFASIAAAWKIITNSEESLFCLMRKKTDPTSRAMVSKYIAHFKAFERIVDSLGEKITNSGHEESATADAKAQIVSFVSNYELFFKEFVDAFFKANEEAMQQSQEKVKQSDMQQHVRALMAKEIDNRQKIKDFEPLFAQIQEGLKANEAFYQHRLLDGLVTSKAKEAEGLREKSEQQARRLAFMVDYNAQRVDFLLENEDNLECSCGGAQLNYYKRTWEESLKEKEAREGQVKSREAIVPMVDENENVQPHQNEQNSEEREILQVRNVQLAAKVEKMKVQGRLSDDAVLQSPAFILLRGQCRDLMDYANDLLSRLNKSHEYLSELERLRLEELDEMRRKMENNVSQIQNRAEPKPYQPDTSFLAKLKSQVLGEIGDLKTLFAQISQRGREKQQSLTSIKESLRGLKRQNDDLSRKVSELQQRQLKGIENAEFRYARFTELESKLGELLRAQMGEQWQRVRKSWQELLQYAKNRDKKIKAMQDMIRRKDKEIASKTKSEEIYKNALAETEAVYTHNKTQLDQFKHFAEKIEKELTGLTDENLRIQMDAEREKAMLAHKLRSEAEARSKLDERLKLLEKVEEDAKTLKERQMEVERIAGEYVQNEKERTAQIRVQLKQSETMREAAEEKAKEWQREALRLSEQRERRSVEIGRLRMRMQAMEQKSEYQVLKMDLQEYKSKVMCRCGADREREVVLKTCPHIFCKKCIEDTTAHRNRKCPICGVRYTRTDIHEICWN